MMMSDRHKYGGLIRALGCGAAAMALVATLPAFAQDAAAVAPSDSAMVNLVRLLIEQGVLTPEKGAVLMRQAQAEAEQVRATQVAARAPDPGPQAASALPAPPTGSVRVAYVPETVRAQIRDELRTEVMAQAKAEGWASPGKAAPDWVDKVRIHGDMRFRSASTFYSSSNSNQIIDVANWNRNGPIETFTGIYPILNATNDRLNTAQIRARLSVEAIIADRFQVGIQLATGDDPGPISTNASFAGGFRKRDIWVQNAYLKGEPIRGITAMIGRFDNPLRSTDLMFDADLAFDGVYGQFDLGRFLNKDFTLAVRGGAFPINFGDDNFPLYAINKRNFRDQYLYTAQAEIGKKFGENGPQVALAAAYHNFTYLRGHVSDPCDVYTSDRIECSTDALAPAFMGKGNSWMFLRRFDLSTQPAGVPITEPQLVGNKFAFRVLDVNGTVTLPISDRIVASLTGNYLRNLAFDPENLCREGAEGQPQNNYSAAPGDLRGVCEPGTSARFTGGNEGYAAYLSIGAPELFRVNPLRAKRGAWAINAGYKYLESDAVPDAFTDSDFHLGGTNAKGYFIGAAYALFDGVTVSGRWLSANEIVDQPLAIDVLHLDLGVAF
jgi:hypothetical protein